ELLIEEIDLVATPDAGIVAVGRVVSDHLEERGFGRPYTCVLHYSGQAAAARNASILGREERFEAFQNTVSVEEFVTTAELVLRGTPMPTRVRDETLLQLTRSGLSRSRRQLIFVYKEAFEAIRAQRESLR